MLGALVLAVSVQLAAAPVLAVDRAVAGGLNVVVAPRPWLVTTLEVLTAPGAAITAWVVLTTLAVALLVRREYRLALFVAVTGLGAATLSPLTKQLVGRLRPVVEMPVAMAGGPSFPSGHTFVVTVWVGVVLLVLLPVVPSRARSAVIAIGVLLVVVVGLTRLALGVHFLSDVLAGWLLGSLWLVTTATAFRAWRRHEGLPVGPVSDGLAPEEAPDLQPAPDPERLPPHPVTAVAQLLVTAVLLLGALVGSGLLLMQAGAGSVVARADVGAVTWLVEHRSAALDAISGPLGEVGNTGVIIAGGAVAAVLALALTRRVGPVLVIVAALVGEVLIFMISAAIVDRPRPHVPHLDAELPPTSSFPSGHTAAAICLYVTLAVLVLRATRARWRWAVLGAAVTVVAAVALSRLYRGAHHPTDVLASVAFAVPWLLVTVRLLGPQPTERKDGHRGLANPRAGPAARQATNVGGFG